MSNRALTATAIATVALIGATEATRHPYRPHYIAYEEESSGVDQEQWIVPAARLVAQAAASEVAVGAAKKTIQWAKNHMHEEDYDEEQGWVGDIAKEVGKSVIKDAAVSGIKGGARWVKDRFFEEDMDMDQEQWVVTVAKEIGKAVITDAVVTGIQGGAKWVKDRFHEEDYDEQGWVGDIAKEVGKSVIKDAAISGIKGGAKWAKDRFFEEEEEQQIGLFDEEQVAAMSVGLHPTVNAHLNAIRKNSIQDELKDKTEYSTWAANRLKLAAEWTGFKPQPTCTVRFRSRYGKDGKKIADIGEEAFKEALKWAKKNIKRKDGKNITIAEISDAFNHSKGKDEQKVKLLDEEQAIGLFDEEIAAVCETILPVYQRTNKMIADVYEADDEEEEQGIGKALVPIVKEIGKEIAKNVIVTTVVDWVKSTWHEEEEEEEYELSEQRFIRPGKELGGLKPVKVLFDEDEQFIADKMFRKPLPLPLKYNYSSEVEERAELVKLVCKRPAYERIRDDKLKFEKKHLLSKLQSLKKKME